MTIRRYEWSEIAIVGGVGGIAGGVLMLAYRLGATVDNLLNFLGGAVGSGLAVAATLWLERRRRARALRQLLESLVIVADASLRFPSIPDELMKAMVITFQQSVEAMEASRLGVTLESPLHQYAFHTAMFWLKKSMADMLDFTDKTDRREMDETTYAERCRQAASCIMGSIEDFLNMKGLPRQPIRALEHSKRARELDNLIKTPQNSG